MTAPFFERIAKIDEIVLKGPAGLDFVQTVLPLLLEDSSKAHFFDCLSDPAWIDVLDRAGQFEDPPAIYRNIATGSVSMPPWPQSRFLARMAARAPEKVLNLMLRIPKTENICVHEDLTDAALAMRAEMAARWVKKETKWVEQQGSLYLLLPEKLGALIGHLAKGSQVETALELARALLAVLPAPSVTAKTGEEKVYRLPPEPRARFDIWHYEQILEKNIPELVVAAGENVLVLFCDLLDSAIRLSRSYEEDEGPEDYSYIWRPAIENHKQNHSYGLKDLLITAVRHAAEQIAKTDPSRVPALVEKLERGPWQWRVFQRIALHLLRVCPDAALPLIVERLTDRTRFDESGLWHEYVLLARDHFAHLSPDDQKKILHWIDTGPDLEQFKVWKEQDAGRRPTEEEIVQYTRYWQLKHLAPLRDVLPPEWRQRYKEVAAGLNEPEHPEFVSYTTSWVGPTSPKSAEDLRSMSVEEIVTFLKTWQPSRDPTSPSPEGLGRVLEAAVASDPERFAVDASRFQEFDPTYVRALLSGLRDGVKEKRTFPWRSVLELCRWVLEQPREIPGRKSEYADLDPGWVWTRKTIAALLSAGFEAGPAKVPFDLRALAWEVLRPITDDPEPTPEYEARYGGSNMDPATLSINTTRGEAMHAVVRYALWVREHIEKGPNGKEYVKRGFEEMPEVREVLNLHLDPERDPALAIRAVYGQWFPWLVSLDHEWAAAHVLKIFPPDESLRDLRDAAWETYITFCEPYDNVFEVLRDEYSRAVERIGVGDTKRQRLANPEEHLVEHLMILYWRGKLALDEPDGLLARFYKKASDALCGYAFNTEGRRLYNTQETIPSEILDRLKALWEWRLTAALADTSPASHAAELAAFGWWFASAKFDGAWAMDQLAAVLQIVPKMEVVDRLVVERLAVLATNKSQQAVECLHLMTEGDTEGWRVRSWREHARTILATAIQGVDAGARQDAIALVDYLGRRGYFEFGDLLPKVPSS